MGNLGGSEILVILLVALIVLGPDKLPEAARQAGKLMHQFRRISTDFRSEFEAAILDAEEDDDDHDPTALPGSEPYRDRDDAETLALEQAARAKGDALVADTGAEAETEAPTSASMAYRPEPRRDNDVPAAPSNTTPASAPSVADDDIDPGAAEHPAS